MKVIKIFGVIVLFRNDFKKVIGLALATVSGLVLAGLGLSLFITGVIFSKFDAWKYRKLKEENSRLKSIIKAITLKLDTLYMKQKVLAQVANLPVYNISSSNLAIGGQISDKDIDKLVAYAKFQENILDSIEKKIKRDMENVKRIPSIPPARGSFSSGFGIRRDPFTGGIEFHKGIDISAPQGTPIVAAADGIVEEVGWSSGGYGNQVVINHQNGIKTRYAHMFKVFVKQGDRVKRGQVIGLMGSTGKSLAPHAHYEVYLNGKPVNPLRYILVDWK